MSDGRHVIARADLILDELASLALELARHLQRRALEAEDLDQAQRVAGAFHQVSRSARQSLALAQKLQRERVRAEHDDLAFTERRALGRRQTRKADARAAMRRLIWTEAERPEHERLRLSADLDLILDAEALTEAFLQAPLQQILEKLCRLLGLKPPPCLPGEAAGGGPRPEEPMAEGAGPPRRSSA